MGESGEGFSVGSEAMSGRNLLLCLLIAAEIIGGSIYLFRKESEPSPPLPDLGKLDEETRQALLELRKKVTDGTSSGWRNLGEGFLGSGYYAAAESCFQKAVRLNPEDLRSAYNLGFTLERTGYTERAIPVLSRIAESPDADAELVWTCWYQVGRCFLRQEDVASAERAFRKIPEFAPAVYQICKLLLREGRFEEAIPLVQEQMDAYPNDVKFLQLLYRAARDRGDEALALELRDREDRSEYLVELEYGLKFLGSMNARFGLGSRLGRAMALKDAGTPEEQSAALLGALSIIRENQFWNYRSVYLALAELYVETGRPEKAIEIIEETRKFSQDGPELLLLEGRAFLAVQRADEAVTVLKRAMRMKPSVEVIDLLLPLVSDSADNRDLRGEKLFRLGFSEYSRNNISDALAYLEAAVELSPQNVKYLYYLADCKRLSGQIQEAGTMFAECLKLSPDHGRAGSRLSWVQRQLSEVGPE